jgi:hypothetical protein
MSKLTESFRAVGVINPHDFYGHGNVFITYAPTEGGRVWGARWRVARPGFQTDPKAAWYDYGNKTFQVWAPYGEKHSEVKRAVLAEAQAWASQRYGITEWKRDPFGSYGDAEFVVNRIKELKAQIRSLAERGGAK